MNLFINNNLRVSHSVVLHWTFFVAITDVKQIVVLSLVKLVDILIVYSLRYRDPGLNVSQAVILLENWLMPMMLCFSHPTASIGCQRFAR